MKVYGFQAIDLLLGSNLPTVDHSRINFFHRCAGGGSRHSPLGFLWDSSRDWAPRWPSLMGRQVPRFHLNGIDANGNRLDKTIVMNSGREIQMEDGFILAAMLVGLFLLTRKGEKPQEVKITSPGKRTQ